MQINIQQLNQRAEGLKNDVLAYVRLTIADDFTFWMENLFTFHDDESGSHINLLASGGFKRDSKVYLYGRELNGEQEWSEVSDEWLSIEQLLQLLTAYARRDEAPEELKGMPDLGDDLGSLMEALFPNGDDYYIKIGEGDTEEVFGPFSQSQKPNVKLSDLRKHKVAFRKASDSAWRDLVMHF